MERTHLSLVLLSSLLSGLSGGNICVDYRTSCSNGCCNVYTLGYEREICCENVITYSNISVIIGATIGGVILLLVIVSIVVCVCCCTKKNRAQAGQVMAAQPAVYSGAYPMQTINMQPGVNQWQLQQSTNTQPSFTATDNNTWQQPPAVDSHNL